MDNNYYGNSQYDEGSQYSGGSQYDGGQPEGSRLATASMVCGVVGVILSAIGCFCCIGYAGIPLCIVSIVLAVVSRKETGGYMNGQAKAGLITGIIGIGIIVIGFIIGFLYGLMAGVNGVDSLSTRI